MPRHILIDAAQRGEQFLSALPDRSVYPTAEALEGLSAFDVPLQEEPVDPAQVLEELDNIGSPATVASPGGRYFGFVIGGTLPAAQGAAVLARFGNDDRTAQVMKHIQAGGEAWASDTVWQGKRALRLSVSSWATTDDDVDRTLRAIFEAHDLVKATT